VIGTSRLLGTGTALIMLGGLGLAACSGKAPAPGAATQAPSATSATGPIPSATAARGTDTPSTSPTVVEPTTTNTLPPPTVANKPAPKKSGPLTAAALPVPHGWHAVALAGGPDEGYQGNGTWVHGRDPRYAAQEVITIGCAAITRDDYRDPLHALEGTYENAAGAQGVGLVLQFSGPEPAARFYDLYRSQVAACTTTDNPVRTTIIPSSAGLIDHRRYPGADWTEVAKLSGARLTMIILSDPGYKISKQAAERLLGQIR